MRVWGLLTALAMSAPVSAQGLQDVADGRLDDVENWNELCEVVDCDLIPVGYDTYVLGSEVYYFPNYETFAPFGGGAETAGDGRYSDETSDAEPSLRSFTNLGYFTITRCCRALMSYYGLLNAVPGRVPSSGRMVASRYDEPSRDNLVSRRLGRYLGGETADLVTAEEAVLAFPLSYNEDFLIISARDELGLHDMRGFALLSKRPLLHGRHVVVGCQVQCSFTTMAFAGGDIATMDHVGDIGDTRPHIHWYWATLGIGNMFLCTMEEVENGCDPSPDEVDVVIPLLAALENMFEAAQVYPE